MTARCVITEIKQEGDGDSHSEHGKADEHRAPPVTFDNGNENDRRKDHPRFKEENIDNNVGVIQPLKDIAAEKGVSASQLAIAWMYQSCAELSSPSLA